ncbi:hypothetical protein SLEP1_g24711 [Rubroshorea leprosula]|uniref:Integrase zinc-binding domain-containing protein n=1 Tax=Rubroshorea leprosula TaxID=152421 RepID=A0AAV5JMR1_9ROSI|nr:hypothetical protein SLEP1_g24711 [Rubroshorea leprosula]
MRLRKKASRYALMDGVLYKRSFSFPFLRCLSPYEAEYALREVHAGVCGSHVGALTLAHKALRQGYYWPNMHKDATDIMQRYPKCQFFAHLTHQPTEELTNLVAPWPFGQWGLDLLSLFVKGVEGVTHLVVGVDYFTKWVEPGPLSSLTSKKVEDFVFNSIIFYLSDHPESNVMVESVIKAILEGIKPKLEQHKAGKAGLMGFEIRFGNWEGPYTIVEVPHPSAYILQDAEGKRVPRVWNVNNLKKFYP